VFEREDKMSKEYPSSASPGAIWKKERKKVKNTMLCHAKQPDSKQGHSRQKRYREDNFFLKNKVGRQSESEILKTKYIVQNPFPISLTNIHAIVQDSEDTRNS